MRVIAGKARRLRLATLDGPDVRPTTDKIKETLFNMLNIHIPGARFLDIFAGSGGIGIEALSRGAKECVFIERDRRCHAIILGNLQHCHMEEDAELLKTDFMAGLRELDRRGEPFDIIFMDPPYQHDLEQKALEFLDGSSLIGPDTIVVAECSISTVIDDSAFSRLQVDREKIYKSNKHVFLGMRE
ncbi:MAG: 16S rRNA (guanine(966)-N(2))-methyltransferase RsmD [Lachnospiraceae bacterium]|nr:16S rRNA (guanine(966)-N(2))-methyltransferase RsmD [Lachnospiraceae bacterium]